MSRPRGNPTTTAERAARQEKVFQKLGTKPQEQIAEELQISRTTLWRDIRALTQRFIAAVDTEDLKELKLLQVEARQRTADGLLEGSVPPDVASAWAKLQDGIEKILGLQAPRKLTVTHQTGAQLTEEGIFRELTKGWSEKEHQEVMDLIHAINARHVPMLEGEVVEKEEGLPKPHVSHHDEEDE